METVIIEEHAIGLCQQKQTGNKVDGILSCSLTRITHAYGVGHGEVLNECRVKRLPVCLDDGLMIDKRLHPWYELGMTRPVTTCWITDDCN